MISNRIKFHKEEQLLSTGEPNLYNSIKENKSYKYWNDRNRYMIIYLENPKSFTDKLLELLRKYGSG